MYFDYFRIVKYNDDIDIKNDSSVLYFPITINDDDLEDGWYNLKIDYRDKIEELVSKLPNYTFVIESDMVDKMPDDSKYIVVDNIMESIDILFKNKLNSYKGKVILVTGSVGKTTTVGFIKQALGDKCLRIYSKRITPLILKCFVINYLTNDYDYLAMEASLWYKEHILYFSETLKPDMSVLINVYPEHIGVKDIHGISDITKFKSYLLKYSNNVIINNMDDELKKLSINDNKVYYDNNLVIDTKVNNIIRINDYNHNIKPYIKTRLTLLEETIAYEVAKYYGVNDSTIIKRLNNALPVENRVIKEMLFDHEIIFDGDVSGVARFKMFSDHYYDKSCIIIVNLTTGGEEDEPYEMLDDVLDNFDYIYVQKSLNKYFKNSNIVYFDKLDFIKDIDSDVTIFMHYGSYFRKYSSFNLEDLDNYYSRCDHEAWSNRMNFINELKKSFNVYYPDLPGFGLEKEPKDKKWGLDDYAKYINDYIINNNLDIDYILGYSFGGAVAVRYKNLFDSDVKLVLVSPALIRNADRSKKFMKTPGFIEPLRKTLRDAYLIKVVKVEEMVYGTRFLRNTYQDIVRINMLDELEKINPSDVKIIYGSNDTMVNPSKVVETVSDDFKNRISFIDGGGHDIANTHTLELTNLILDFTHEKSRNR